MAYDWVNYTEWGDFLVNGKNGIKQTSTVCSIFEDTPDLKAEANYSGAVLYSSTIPGIIEQFSCTDQNPENCKRFDLSGINPLLSSIQLPLRLIFNPCCFKSFITFYQGSPEQADK
jgi:hypothetical protein